MKQVYFINNIHLCKYNDKMSLNDYQKCYIIQIIIKNNNYFIKYFRFLEQSLEITPRFKPIFISQAPLYHHPQLLLLLDL